MVQRREEDLKFGKHQGSSLVQKLKARAIEQERVLVDKGLWEPKLTGERMDG